MTMHIYYKTLTYEEHLSRNLESALDRLLMNGEINVAGQVTEQGKKVAAEIGRMLGHPKG